MSVGGSLLIGNHTSRLAFLILYLGIVVFSGPTQAQTIVVDSLGWRAQPVTSAPYSEGDASPTPALHTFVAAGVGVYRGSPTALQAVFGTPHSYIATGMPRPSRTGARAAPGIESRPKPARFRVPQKSTVPKPEMAGPRSGSFSPPSVPALVQGTAVPAAPGRPLAPPSRAEPDAVVPWDKDYLAGFYKVPWGFAERPFDTSREALILDSVVLTGFGLLLLLDEEIQDQALDAQSGGATDFFDTVEPLGDFYPLLAAGAAAWTAGTLFDARRLQMAGLNGFQSVLLAAIPVQLTKSAFGRARPNDGEGSGAWFDGGKSFLSGHTTFSFAAASAIAHAYEDTAWVPWTAYTLAALVGAQRIYADKHWASDVFVSALVGWGVGQAVSDFDAFSGDGPAAVGALPGSGRYGLALTLDL